MSYDHNDLQNLADELSNLFRIEKGLQLGRTYRPHPSSNKNEYWLNAAETCLDLGAKPIDYIKSAFSFNAAPGGPFPSIYGGKAIRRYYRDYAKTLNVGEDSSVFEETIKYEIKAVFQSCHQRFRKTNIPLRDTLASSVMPFAAYTRIYLCPGDVEIFTKYKDAVKEEFKLNPALMSVLKKLKMNIDKLYE
jgi:hypothetical protein